MSPSIEFWPLTTPAVSRRPTEDTPNSCGDWEMAGCWVELQLEKTELDWPLSDRDTVSEAEQSGGRDSL